MPRKVIDALHRRAVTVFLKRALKIDHFVNAKLQASPGALQTLKKTGAPNFVRLSGVELTVTDHRHGDFRPAVKDISHTASQLAILGILRLRGLVDVGNHE